MRWSSIPLVPANLTLANTLPVGQSFLWHRHDQTYSRAVDNPPRVVFLRQNATHLEFAAVHPESAATDADYDTGLTKRWIHDYFQLQHNLPQLYAEWRLRDPELFGRTDLVDAIGVRVLRQDPWETLIA
jgi:N-glycosylase/DNA lyase